MMKRVIVWILILLVGASLLTPALEASSDSDYDQILNLIDGEKAWSIVNDLAGDRFEGRRSGTRGADLASEYVADYFKSIGLKPAGTGGSYRSNFKLPLWELARIPTLALTNRSGGVSQAFEYRKDFNVIPGSGKGNYSAEVVFAGYGITAKSIGYDDYAEISAGGKVVLALVGTPTAGQFQQGEYGAVYAKAEIALSHGAVGLILVDNPAEPTARYVERWRCGACWTIYEKLIILGGAIGLADGLLKDSGSTLSSIQQKVNQDLKPRSLALRKRLHVSVEVSFSENANAYNVLGFISGSDPSASKKAVIIGAHYDHWGKDVDGSILRGANDDASGVAVMMEIARVLSTSSKPKLSVLFAAWSGEEEGFYGSQAYVGYPYFPLGETVAYLNLDMVGYGEQLLGEVSENYNSLRMVMKESAEELHISLHVEGASGGSDNIPFEKKGVPNLMFIYWPDDVYHTSADTAAHVSRRNLVETAKLTALVSLRLSEAGTTTTPIPLLTGAFTVEVLAIAGIACVVIVGVVVFYFRKQRA